MVLDASVLIAHLDSHDPHHERARTLLLTETAQHALAASPITLAEVLVGPTRAGLLDRASAALRHLGVTAVPWAEDAAPRLAVLRVGTGLKLPDCCVLLSAEQTSGAMATFDERLATAACRRGIAVQPG